MFIGLLAIFSAIVLSVVSAAFSIQGIITIFSGAVLGAGVMGGTLEFSKIVATIWLYSWWKKASKLLKAYLVFAVVVLITISSIGIFGFLARAYVGQRNPGQEIEGRITRIDLSIEREERNIDRSQEALDLLDQSIEQFFSLNAISLGLQRREEQRSERDFLRQEMVESQQRIDELLDERFRLENQLNEFTVNVGPIEYIAVLIYGEQNAEDNFDNAARILIILFVLVFDPFAVLLMVAGNISFDENRKTKRRRRSASKRTQKKSVSRKPSKKVNAVDKSVDSNEEDVEPQTEKTEEIFTTPSQPRPRKKIVQVDMSDYIDSEEIQNIKDSIERPRKKRY